MRGRADDMINTGGEKVAADEVAGGAGDCPGVREAAVVGAAGPGVGRTGHRDRGARRPGGPARPGRAARGARAGRLPAYAAPRALVLVPAIPLLPSGKPDLQALRRLARQD